MCVIRESVLPLPLVKSANVSIHLLADFGGGVVAALAFRALSAEDWQIRAGAGAEALPDKLAIKLQVTEGGFRAEREGDAGTEILEGTLPP